MAHSLNKIPLENGNFNNNKLKSINTMLTSHDEHEDAIFERVQANERRPESARVKLPLRDNLLMSSMSMNAINQ